LPSSIQPFAAPVLSASEVTWGGEARHKFSSVLIQEDEHLRLTPFVTGSYVPQHLVKASEAHWMAMGASQFLCEAVQSSDFSRPFGTRGSRNQRDPRLESLGYSRMSLRDMSKSEMRPTVSDSLELKLR
jgi:hypothetical protein